MMAQTELYRFVEQGFVDPFSRDNNLFFVIDASGSMNTLAVGTRTRLDVTKAQINQALDQLVEIAETRGVNISVAIHAFSASINTIQKVSTLNAGTVDSLKAYVSSITAIGGTPYNVPMRQIIDHYSIPSPGCRRAVYFITDGAPEPISSADTAITMGQQIIQGRGKFSRAVDNYVQIYGVAVDQFDTTYLAQLDNTPRDGVQSVSSESSGGLYNAILAADYEEKVVYTFTNAPHAIEFGGEVFEPAAISHSESESKEDLARANLTVTMPRDLSAAIRWVKDSPEVQITCTIWHIDEDDEVSVVWKGRLSAAKPSGVEVQAAFDSIYTSLSKAGLGARFQRMCRHTLYGSGCHLAAAAHSIIGEPTTIQGNTVTIPQAASYPNGWFSGGYIETPDGSRRFIVGHVGSVLTLFRPMEALNEAFLNKGYGLNYGAVYGGLRIKIFPGCDRSRQTCHTKFNNLANYGGFDWIPTKNPFAGSSIL